MCIRPQGPSMFQPSGTIIGLEKVPISPWLVTLLHICLCSVIQTPQLPISPETPRRYCRKLCVSADVAAPSSDVTAPSTDVYALSLDIVALNGEFKCFMMFDTVLTVFHDVFTSGSWCFTSSSRCFMLFHDVSQCFTSVPWCFTMFNNVLRCLANRAMIGIGDSVTAWPPIASGIVTMPQGSRQCRRDRRWSLRDCQYWCESDPMVNVP